MADTETQYPVNLNTPDALPVAQPKTSKQRKWKSLVRVKLEAVGHTSRQNVEGAENKTPMASMG